MMILLYKLVCGLLLFIIVYLIFCLIIVDFINILWLKLKVNVIVCLYLYVLCILFILIEEFWFVGFINKGNLSFVVICLKW